MGVIVRPELNDGWKPVFGSGYRLNPDHPLNKGLVAWFLGNIVNERSGNYVLSDINGGVSISPTNKGRTWLFSGVNGQCLQVPMNADLPITMTCWYNAVSFSKVLLGFFQSGSGTNAHYLSVESAGNPVRAFSTDGASWPYSTVGASSAGSWYHAGGVFAASNSRLAYQNAIQGTVETTNLALSPTRFIIGSYVTAASAYSNTFDGFISDAKVWRRALTPFEILYDYLYPYGTPDNPRLLFPSTRTWFVPAAAPSGFALPIGHYYFNNMRA